MTTDDVLARMGLQARKTTFDYLFPALGVFGAGIFVGAGVALLLAPKSGSELRHELGRTAGSIRQRVMPGKRRNGNGDLTRLSRDELYDRAKEMDIPGRAEMSKSELIEAIQSS